MTSSGNDSETSIPKGRLDDDFESAQLLLEFAKLSIDRAKHHEDLRERATALLLISAGFCLAVIGLDQEISGPDVWIGIFLLLIGIYGCVLCIKYYYYYTVHNERYRSFRRSIDLFAGKVSLENIVKTSDQRASEIFPYQFIRGIPLHILWCVLPLIISLFGFLIIIISIVST